MFSKRRSKDTDIEWEKAVRIRRERNDSILQNLVITHGLGCRRVFETGMYLCNLNS